jgi:hypothetical protein
MTDRDIEVVKKLVKELVAAELAKLEEPMNEHIAGEITRQLDERKHKQPAQIHGLKPGMEVK